MFNKIYYWVQKWFNQAKLIDGLYKQITFLENLTESQEKIIANQDCIIEDLNKLCDMKEAGANDSPQVIIRLEDLENEMKNKSS